MRQKRLFYLRREAELNRLNPKENLDMIVAVPTEEDERLWAAETMAMNLLKSEPMEFEPSPGFDQRLVRMIRVERAKSTWAYWVPAFCGAAVAALAILATMQVIDSSGKENNERIQGASARAEIERPIIFPNLDRP